MIDILYAYVNEDNIAMIWADEVACTTCTVWEECRPRDMLPKTLNVFIRTGE